MSRNTGKTNGEAPRPIRRGRGNPAVKSTRPHSLASDFGWRATSYAPLAAVPRIYRGLMCGEAPRPIRRGRTAPDLPLVRLDKLAVSMCSIFYCVCKTAQKTYCRGELGSPDGVPQHCAKTAGAQCARPCKRDFGVRRDRVKRRNIPRESKQYREE